MALDQGPGHQGCTSRSTAETNAPVLQDAAAAAAPNDDSAPHFDPPRESSKLISIREACRQDETGRSNLSTIVALATSTGGLLDDTARREACEVTNVLH